MLHALLVAGAVLCAVQAIRARQLLSAALWLAGVSALVAILLYRLGAQQVAVVELSVGAGLVTVLFVFAISIAGDDALQEREFLPNWLAIGLAALFAGLLGATVLPLDLPDAAAVEDTFASVLWSDRALDVLIQLVLIFTGVLCLVGLLTDSRPPERSVSMHEGHSSTVPASHNGHRPAGAIAHDRAIPAEPPATEPLEEVQA